jgi:hypothetical protein
MKPTHSHPLIRGVRPLLMLGLLMTGAHASSSPEATIFSPEKGVICDRRAGYCADGTGISATWTAQHLGQKAAQDLASMLTESKSLNPMSLGNVNYLDRSTTTILAG